MSFYGNITNTSRTQFQFDKIYPNKVEMENHKSTDGIYAGRFVLVEYDSEMHMDTFLRISRIEQVDGKQHFYAVVNRTNPQAEMLTRGHIHYGRIVYTSAFETSPDNGYYMKNCTFYKCITNYEDGSIEPAEFEEIVGEQDNSYITNYQLDVDAYGRGYDSTVWQKVYVGGQEKYIMIAELNTVVPTFEIEIDAPTQMPLAPHFDIESSDIYYKLHCQPNWGFRVKSARLERGQAINLQGDRLFDEEGNPIDENYTSMTLGEMRSDETTVWTKEIYDPENGTTNTYYWHAFDTPQNNGYTGVWLLEKPENTKETPAAIYYNKAGFSVDKNIIDDIEDHISITPTGKSGQIYNTHNQSSRNTTEKAADIQELSIILPSIGNSIAQMWNIIYGEGTERNSVKYRNMDINWDSYEGLRMVNGTARHATYNPENVSTLAGTINSVHDLMGMIIVEVEELDLKTMDEKHIYYCNGKYYKKYVTNKYTQFIVGDGIKQIPKHMTYREINWELNEFENTLPEYCYQGSLREKAPKYIRLFPEDHFEYGNEYITSNDDNDIFIRVHPKNYLTGTWYKNINNISMGDYEGETGYTIELNASPTINTEYFKFNFNNIDTDPLLSGKKPYIANIYYVYNNGAEIDTSLSTNEILADIELSSTYNAAYKYYLARFDESGNIVFTLQEVFDPNTIENLYYKIINENDKFISCKNLNNQISIPGSTIYDNNIEFGTLSIGDSTKYFFGQYYDYYVKTETFILDEYGNQKPYEEYNLSTPIIGDESGNTAYFIKADNIIPVNLNPKDYMEDSYEGPRYYVNNTYYYQLPNQQYVLDKNYEYSTNVGQYYVKDKALFVTTDPKGYFNIGAEWNPNILTIPDGIILSTQEPEIEARELVGFARELNTIHGLILEIHKILAMDDSLTRDNTTVSGAINLLNDIVHKFDIIAAKQIMIVDDYGRVHSTPVTDDKWIQVDIDSNPTTPNIHISHEYHPTEVNNTESSQDEDNSDGVLKFETVTIDATGHVTAKHIETVDLPHNFKNITLGDNSIIAKNHIATLNIEGDEWLNWTLDNENSKLSLSHTEPLAYNHRVVGLDSNQTLDFGSTTQIPKIIYDSKGHIFATTSMEITLPELSIEGDAAEGYILSGVNANGTKLTKQQLTSVVLDGYTGTKENVSAADTLGKALEVITNAISSIKANYATDTELVTAINTLRTDLTDYIDSAIATLKESNNLE